MSFEINGELVPSGGGDSIPLLRDSLVLGRRESCDIPLRFPNVSQQHAQLVFHAGYWYIRDLNSTNGVKVNGQRVVHKLLHPNDEITIAKRRYTIKYTLVAGRKAMAEMEDDDDVMGQSLLEKAGLERHRDDDDSDMPTTRRRHFDPNKILRGDSDEEDENDE
jgi:adenylate cyclase